MGSINMGMTAALFYQGTLKLKALAGAVNLSSSQQIDHLTDNELISLTLAGQKKAFEGIVRRYQKLVYNMVFQMVRSHETAADLTQETFQKAYKNLGAFRHNAKLKPWLLKIASNATLNQIRDSKGRYFDSLEELLEESPNAEPSSTESVEELVENRFSQAMLADALQRLSPRHRQIFILRFQQDLSYADIATVVNETESAVKSMLFRIREKLRKMMSEHQRVEE